MPLLGEKEYEVKIFLSRNAWPKYIECLENVLTEIKSADLALLSLLPW